MLMTLSSSKCSSIRSCPPGHSPSLHDALPISIALARRLRGAHRTAGWWDPHRTLSTPVGQPPKNPTRSEEHTSELQSRQYLVCRPLLQKKTRPRFRGSRHQLPDRLEDVRVRRVLGPRRAAIRALFDVDDLVELEVLLDPIVPPRPFSFPTRRSSDLHCPRAQT